MFAVGTPAQTPPPEELKKKVDAYLRYMFAFGTDVKLAVGTSRKAASRTCWRRTSP
jgi:hypothetical protein